MFKKKFSIIYAPKKSHEKIMAEDAEELLRIYYSLPIESKQAVLHIAYQEQQKQKEQRNGKYKITKNI